MSIKIWILTLPLLALAALAIFLGRTITNRKVRKAIRDGYAIFGAIAAATLIFWQSWTDVAKASERWAKGSCDEVVVAIAFSAILFVSFLFGVGLHLLVDIAANYRRQSNQKNRSILRKEVSAEEVCRAKCIEATKATEAAKAPHFSIVLCAEPKWPKLNNEHEQHLDTAELIRLMSSHWGRPFDARAASKMVS